MFHTQEPPPLKYPFKISDNTFCRGIIRVKAGTQF